MSLGQNDNAILKLLADEQLRKENASLAAENERLTAEVEWLRKADRLVCWNLTTQQWEVRHEALK